MRAKRMSVVMRRIPYFYPTFKQNYNLSTIFREALPCNVSLKKRVASNVPIVAIDVTTKNEWEGPPELVRPWGSGVGSAVHCSGVTSDNGPAVNGPAVTSRNCVLDPHKNETLDVVTSKIRSAILDLVQTDKRLWGTDRQTDRQGGASLCIFATNEFQWYNR